MARPPGITDEEVLAAARVVFAGKGASATMEEVAERCHVGVATIFRRFPTKQALFSAAVNVNDAEWERFLARRMEADPSANPRARLLELATFMLDSARKIMPLIMMKMANPSLADKERGTSRVLWIMRALTDFFKLEIDAGRMIAVDPRVAARVWLGAVRHVAMFEALGAKVDDLSSEDFIEGLVDMFCVPALVKTRNE